MSIRTFSDAVDSLKLVYHGKCKYLFNYLSWWQQHLGSDKLLVDVTIDDIDAGMSVLMNTPAFQFKRGIGTIEAKKHRSPATVNRYVSAIATMVRTLKQARYLPRSFVSPIIKGTKLSEGRGRTVQVTIDDVHRLVSGARLTRNGSLPALIAVACTSGLRKGSLQGLRWGDVDLQNGLIDVQVTKNGAPVRSVLPDWVVRELLRIKPTVLDKSAPVFGRKEFKKSFASALKHADLPTDWTFHHCRHIAASILSQSGANIVTVMACLGHKTPSMSLRYSHLNTAAIEAAVSKAWT